MDGGAGTSLDLLQRLENSLRDFTPAERAIANFILNNRGGIAFESADSIAEKLDVSSVTVGSADIAVLDQAPGGAGEFFVGERGADLDCRIAGRARGEGQGGEHDRDGEAKEKTAHGGRDRRPRVKRPSNTSPLI